MLSSRLLVNVFLASSFCSLPRSGLHYTLYCLLSLLADLLSLPASPLGAIFAPTTPVDFVFRMPASGGNNSHINAPRHAGGGEEKNRRSTQTC
eukprot:680327-Hanusia_phi.AAC.3